MAAFFAALQKVLCSAVGFKGAVGPILRRKTKVGFVRRADIGSPSFGALAANGCFVSEAVVQRKPPDDGSEPTADAHSVLGCCHAANDCFEPNLLKNSEI